MIDEISKFNVLTKYIVKISNTESYGEWIIDRENDGTLENPIHMPYVNYNELVKMFISDFYQFSNSHPEYQLTKYSLILVNKNNDIKEINIKLVYIKIDEISKEEYDAAEGYNVIEDFSLKEESRKYYSLTILCVVDNVEYELVTFGVGKKGNLKEIYQMSFTSEFGIGEIWLFNYEDYLRIDFNSPDDIKLFKEDSK